MSSLTLTLKRFRLAPLLLCAGISLALNLWPALSQAQTGTLSADPLFMHYSNLPGYVTVTAKLSATAVRGTDYTTADPLPAIIIDTGDLIGSATLFIGLPDGMTERDTKTSIVRGRAPGVSVPPATITLVRDDKAQDQAVLQALYQATNGAGWTTNTNWNSSESLDTWHGVTTNSAGRVVALDLSGNSLSGPIPTQVGGLADLQILDLSANKLSGPIPDINNLPDLTHLDLSANKLSGPIPDINNLPMLTHLDLSGNSLSGPIPTQVGGLADLQILDLSANKLSGPIPDINNLPMLTHLDLSGNSLSGPIPALD